VDQPYAVSGAAAGRRLGIMINVSICDDEQSGIDVLLKYIDRWASQHKENIKTKTYHSPDILLADFDGSVDILLLDIKMKEMNGVETARILRKRNSEVCIIFITSMAEAAIECYSVRAFSFLTKPLSYAEFDLEFTDAVRVTTGRRDDYLLINTDNSLNKVNIHNILYIEVLDHTISLHLNDGRQLQCYGSMRDFESRVKDKGFFRCHSGYLVNYSYIEKISSSQIQLRGGAQIPLSRHRKNEFLSEICRYVGVRI
jgi:two-component system, LytTR family, response regulator LytT